MACSVRRRTSAGPLNIGQCRPMPDCGARGNEAIGARCCLLAGGLARTVSDEGIGRRRPGAKGCACCIGARMQRCFDGCSQKISAGGGSASSVLAGPCRDCRSVAANREPRSSWRASARLLCHFRPRKRIRQTISARPAADSLVGPGGAADTGSVRRVSTR
jgi:hypothetical protein